MARKGESKELEPALVSRFGLEVEMARRGRLEMALRGILVRSKVREERSEAMVRAVVGSQLTGVR